MADFIPRHLTPAGHIRYNKQTFTYVPINPQQPERPPKGLRVYICELTYGQRRRLVVYAEPRIGTYIGHANPIPQQLEQKPHG